MELEEPTLSEQYNDLKPDYILLANYVREEVEVACTDQGIDCFYEARAKDVDNFVAKTQRPDKSYTSPLTEITDLAGIRIIAISKAHLSRINDVIHNLFEISSDHSGSKGDAYHVDQFGYEADHYVGKVGHAAIHPVRGDLWFEIQVRSVLQDAWARVSRGGFYGSSAPHELRRRLHALAAVLELADKEFDLVRSEAAALHSEATARIQSDPSSVEITTDTLTVYLEEADIVEHWAAVTRAQGVAMSMHVGDIARDVEMLGRCGIRTLSQLNGLLTSAEVWGNAFLKRYYAIYRLSYAETMGRAPEGLSTDRNGIASMFAAAHHPYILTASVLEEEFGWGDGWKLHEARRDRNISVTHDGVRQAATSRDILGLGRFHDFLVWTVDATVLDRVSITMSGTAEAVMRNRGLDPDNWIETYGPEIIQLRPDRVEDGAEFMLSWGEVEALAMT